jgi:serine/threonine protein phosphatase PrpC
VTPADAQNWALLTDVGHVRTHNEDSVMAQPPLFVVADGLGGHEAGEVASSIAVETLRDTAPKRADAKALGRAVRAANREVIRAAREGYGRSGMGTTITAAIVEGSHIAVAHVGDSRAYLLHDGMLERVTADHSMVADMVRRGQITEEESRIHPHRSVITRALGTDPNMYADTYDVDASAGDRLLLASDGLTGMLTDAEITALLLEHRDPQDAARMLVDAANDAGGVDNISVVVVDIEGQTTASAGRDRRIRSWAAAAAWVLVALLVAGGIAAGVYRYASNRAYLIAENGVVVIYRGVPGNFAGLTLSWRSETTTLPVSVLPPAQQARVREGITVDNLAEAKALLEEYRSRATTGASP